MYAKVIKLTNRGWKTNERYVRLDTKSLCYYSKTTDEAIKKVHSGKMKPK